MTTNETYTVHATVGYETIVLVQHGGNDGSLVISDGRGLQLITLNMRRFPALLEALQKLERRDAADK